MVRTEEAASSRQSDTEAQLRTLFLRGLQGDQAAYRAFLQQLSAHLRAFLRRRLFGWPDDVEDLVQECLLAMHNKRHTYQSDQPLTAWVHAIARYKLIDLLRSKSVREALHDPLDDALAVFAESSTDASDARRDLGGLLDTLRTGSACRLSKSSSRACRWRRQQRCWACRSRRSRWASTAG